MSDSCCGRSTQDTSCPPDAPCSQAAAWIDGSVDTAVGDVPRAMTALTFADRVGSCKARWAIGRMQYRIEPGLYAVGRPTSDSPVLVTANYKMSFDRLRCELAGIDAWIVVLDTNGINVWCAAGKGTFGTDELLRRIDAVRLARVVSHRTLILPQLGAVGVAAHEVRRQSGFRVIYGPVRAADLPTFLADGNQATPEMRRVRFTLADRLALVPVELVMGIKYALAIAVGLFLLAGLGTDWYSPDRALSVGSVNVLVLFAAFLAGVVFAPMFLPWLPGRSFSAKGLWIGLLLAAGLIGYTWSRPDLFTGRLALTGWVLMIPAITSFVAMNFTGASTYTSLSGVRQEMRFALPLQTAAAVAGVGLWLVGRFV